MIGQIRARLGASSGLLDVAALGGSRALAALLASLAALLVAPALGPEQLGVWSMLLAVQAWALHLSELGQRSVVTAEAPRTIGGARGLLRTYLILRLGLAVIVGGVVLIGATKLAGLPSLAMALVLTSLVSIGLQLDWVALVDGRTGQAALVALVRPLTFCLLVLAAPAPLTVARVAQMFALAWAAAAVVSWSVLLPGAVTRSGGDPPITAGTMVRLGVPLGLVTLSSQLLTTLDLIAVGAWLGPSSAGQLYLASAMAVAGVVFANAYNQWAMARLSPLRDDPQVFTAAVRLELRQALLVGLGVGVVVAGLAPGLVPVLFGRDFALAGELLVWLVPWLVLQHPTAVLLGAMTAARRQRAMLAANALALAAFGLALGGALATGDLRAVALARGAAELVRLGLLWRALER